MGRHQSVGAEAVLASFPYQPETVRITGEPTIPKLIDLFIALCANGAQTAADWCTRGHLVRVLGLQKYQERFPQDIIVIPTHPGIMHQGAAFDYPQRKALHDEALERFDRMTDFDQACLNFVIQCVDDDHLAGIRDPTMGITMKIDELFDFFYELYGANVTASEIEAAKMRMLTPWTIEQPFSVVVKQIDHGRLYLEAVKQEARSIWPRFEVKLIKCRRKVYPTRCGNALPLTGPAPSLRLRRYAPNDADRMIVWLIVFSPFFAFVRADHLFASSLCLVVSLSARGR